MIEPFELISWHFGEMQPGSVLIHAPIEDDTVMLYHHELRREQLGLLAVKVFGEPELHPYQVTIGREDGSLLQAEDSQDRSRQAFGEPVEELTLYGAGQNIWQVDQKILPGDARLLVAFVDLVGYYAKQRQAKDAMIAANLDKTLATER